MSQATKPLNCMYLTDVNIVISKPGYLSSHKYAHE